jgi:hypothetical protein
MLVTTHCGVGVKGNLTGVHTNDAFAIVLTIASAEALYHLCQFLRTS